MPAVKALLQREILKIRNYTLPPGPTVTGRKRFRLRRMRYWLTRALKHPTKTPYWNNHQKGIYVSAATGKPMFSSDAKFDSGTGWPSFFKPLDPKAIKIVKDYSYGEVREEVVEATTGLHLGHVFDDGPAPTGKRYCMDSYAFKFIPSK